MNTALWIVQGLLAFAFLAAGLMKATRPLPELAAKMSWVPGTPPGLVRFIGWSEVAGAVGVVVPAATGIVPVLTPVAAAALVVVMLLAARTHARHKEYGMIGANAVLAGLAGFVAWGRLG